MPMKNPPHPGGFVLRQCIEPLGLTITQAAAALGCYNRNAAINPYLVEGKKTCGLEIAEHDVRDVVTTDNVLGALRDLGVAVALDDYGSGQFAEVWITFEPLERSAGFEFVDKTVGGSVPKEFVPAVEKGLKIKKEDGVLAKYPTVDFRATLNDGSYHDVDSNALTFEIAAKAAFREGIRKAGPILLEPVMKVETVTPGDYLGDVIGDINRRRGMIQDQLERGSNIAVVATVPLSEMFGYIGQLRGMTSGRASYTMEFSHYEPVPKNVADAVIAEAAKPAAVAS